MPRKPAHEQFDTLKAIQDRAFDLFGRYGYEGVSIGDIAKAARLSKGALYWHFSGKQALYLDCLQRLHAIFHTYVLDPVRLEAEPVRAVLCLFTGLQQMLQDPRVEHGVAGYWLTPSTPETAAIIEMQRAFEALAVQTLRDTLQRGVDRRQLDFAGDLEPLARAIVSLIEACVLPLRHQEPEEVRSLLGVLARTLFRAYGLSDDLQHAAEQALRFDEPKPRRRHPEHGSR